MHRPFQTLSALENPPALSVVQPNRTQVSPSHSPLLCHGALPYRRVMIARRWERFQLVHVQRELTGFSSANSDWPRICCIVLLWMVSRVMDWPAMFQITNAVPFDNRPPYSVFFLFQIIRRLVYSWHKVMPYILQVKAILQLNEIRKSLATMVQTYLTFWKDWSLLNQWSYIPNIGSLVKFFFTCADDFIQSSCLEIKALKSTTFRNPLHHAISK